MWGAARGTFVPKRKSRRFSFAKPFRETRQGALAELMAFRREAQL
jgi:hypothetical protein